MTSKAARRRANKRRLAAVSLPGEPRAEQPARQPDGRIRPVDARKPALEARLARGGVLSAAEIDAASAALKSALQSGSQEERKARVKALAKKVDAARRKKAASDMFETDVGYCANYILPPREADAVVEMFNQVRASYRNYCLLYIGQTGNPQCAAIAMIPEPMETDPSLRVDLRTHDEKVRAAKASWAAWEARIKALPLPQLRWAIEGTLRGFMGDGTLWRDAKPTDTGRKVVAALRAMVA